MKISRLICIIGGMFIAFGAVSQVRLPGLFSDGMVLQQQSRVPIWGWGEPAEKLQIVSS